MNDSQQAMSRSISLVAMDVSRKIEHLYQQSRAHSPYHAHRIRLSDMKQEADDLVNIVTEQLSDVTPEFLAAVDQHFDDVRERLVALQTQIHAFSRQYSNI